jgi:hypothetical protein
MNASTKKKLTRAEPSLPRGEDPTVQKINFYLPKEDYRRFKAKAVMNDTNASNLFREWVSAYLSSR